MKEVDVRLILAHAGGLDEFLLILGLVGLPLVVLGFLARRAGPDDDEDDVPVD